MKRKLLALFAACSMITTSFAGWVQTAHAAGPVSVVVSNGATDTEKVLTINYACDGIMSFEGYLTFDNENVTVNSTTFNLAYPSDMGDKNAAVYEADPSRGYQIMITTFEDDPMENNAKSVATVNITVPGDVDVEATLTFEVLQEREWNDVDCSPITVTIPASTVTPPGPNPTNAPTSAPTAPPTEQYIEYEATVNEGEAEATVNIINTFDENKSVVVMVAQYASTGELITIKAQEIDVPANTVSPETYTVKADAVAANMDHIRCYVWDGLNSMKPIKKMED